MNYIGFANAVFMLDGLINISKQENDLLLTYQNCDTVFRVPMINKKECEQALEQIKTYLDNIK